MRVHDRERRIVADGADVAEVVRQPFELSHQGSQISRARRSLEIERPFDRVGESDSVGDGAVTGGAGGQPRRPLDARASHQRLDTLVRVAQALFEPHHRLPAGGEAEMSRLDDAGMYRPNGNLVQALALDR